jgi:hypothetical protein
VSSRVTALLSCAGCRSVCEGCKGSVFDVAFRPVLVPMSSFVLRGGGQDSRSPARTRLPADVGEGLRGDAVKAIESIGKSANEKDERCGLRVWPYAAPRMEFGVRG